MTNHVKKSYYVTKLSVSSGFKCEKCGEIETSIRFLKAHMRRFHSY